LYEAPGDFGAWVVCADTSLIIGVVVSVSQALQLTYVSLAETIFKSIKRVQVTSVRACKTFFLLLQLI
jgi:hypothetical protein